VISRPDIVGRVQEWGLAEHVVEKDYVLGWVLWGIGSDATLGDSWIFKGGTCLKKCYIETYRFSEDLDFTILPGGPLAPDEVLPLLHRVLQRVGEESGIDFAVGEPRLRIRPSGTAAEGRIYYRGPRNTPGATSVKLDLSADETVIRPTVPRTIAHPYPDALPVAGTARCYSFEEVFAEKLRAMAQRGRPRDLYDIVNLFRRDELRPHAALIREVLVAKCQAKGIPLPTAETIASASHRDELESEWANMLGHQLPALPPLDQFVGELPALFAWLHGEADPAPLPAIPIEPDEDDAWRPSATVAIWRQRVPLEPLRFAGTNHLCVDLTYDGAISRVQPYSLRRTRAGDLVLHALRSGGGELRFYRVDRIQRVEVTTEPFRPVHAIELSPSGPLRTPAHEDVDLASDGAI
jgi:predicted nucleotidyltransferase component of viral defense system